MNKIDTIVFDLGNVLVDWNVQYVYHNKYFATVEQRDYFLKEICNMAWHEQQDAGRSIVEGTQDLVNRFPEWEAAIRDFYGKWQYMFGGPIKESVEVLKQLKSGGKYRLYALSNWHHGLFDLALSAYDFLHWFDGRVISGEEQTRKPFPQIYERLFDRYNVIPENAVFIDDNSNNIAAAKQLGLKTILFTEPGQLKQQLEEILMDKL